MVVLITGGAAGIGRAIARRCASAGAAVALCDRDAAGLAEACRALQREDWDCLEIGGDVSELQQARETVEEVVHWRGRIDVLVNNAGVSKANPIDDPAGPQTWREVLGTNLDGVYHCCHAALPHMPDDARIVNMASVFGKVGGAAYTAYCASKHGVVGFTRALAVEVAARGITVNAVCPGWVETDMARRDFVEGAGLVAEPRDRFQQRELARVPLGRLIHPDEVADLVWFLASPASRNITGQAISICGGLVMA